MCLYGSVPQKKRIGISVRNTENKALPPEFPRIYAMHHNMQSNTVANILVTLDLQCERKRKIKIRGRIWHCIRCSTLPGKNRIHGSPGAKKLAKKTTNFEKMD